MLETAICDPRLENVYRYWEQKRRGRIMPSRADIDPSDLPGALWPHILLLDVVHQGGRLRFRYRRVGGEFWSAEGCDGTGRFVDEMAHWPEWYRDYVGGFYRETVVRRRAIYTSNLFTTRSATNPPLVAKRVTLPLASDSRTVDMIMTAHVFEYPRHDRGAAFSLVNGVEEYARIVLE